MLSAFVKAQLVCTLLVQLHKSLWCGSLSPGKLVDPYDLPAKDGQEMDKIPQGPISQGWALLETKLPGS
jgi:hypothetical protein